MEKYDFFKVCGTCQDEECCKEPYYAFVASNEIKRIKKRIKKLKLKVIEAEDFYEFEEIPHKNRKFKFRTIKKIAGECIFLENNRNCLIHDVKPFDCKIWPLTWDYLYEENKLVIYMGLCPLTDKMPNSWIESTIEKIQIELKTRTKEELIAYSLLDRDDTLEIIREIENFLE